MLRLLGGNALVGILLGMAMVGFGLSEHLTLFAIFGGYVGLVSVWRWIDGARDDRRPGG
jgi:hypothetical protein